MYPKTSLIRILFASLGILCLAQNFDSTVQYLQGLPNKYISKINEKISTVEDKFTKQTVRYINKLQRQEDKIKRHLSKIDSSVTANFTIAKKKYSELSNGVKSKAALISMVIGG